jgi:hypothetical protein
VAKLLPGGVAGRTFRHKDGHHLSVAELAKAVAVSQHLTEAQPELLFFVLIGDALDLGDKDCSVCLPGEVEVRLVGEPGPRLDACQPQDACQRVLGGCVPVETSLDKAGSTVNGCRSVGNGLNLGFPVRGAERPGCQGGATG